jgi:hypothetical protein
MAAEVEADRRVQARHAFGGVRPSSGAISPRRRSVRRRGPRTPMYLRFRGSRARRSLAILLVAVGHDDGGVGGIDVGEGGIEAADARGARESAPGARDWSGCRRP